MVEHDSRGNVSALLAVHLRGEMRGGLRDAIGGFRFYLRRLCKTIDRHGLTAEELPCRSLEYPRLPGTHEYVVGPGVVDLPGLYRNRPGVADVTLRREVVDFIGLGFLDRERHAVDVRHVEADLLHLVGDTEPFQPPRR